MSDSAKPPPPLRPDLARLTLGVLFIGAMLIGSLWVLRPFLGAIVWATMIVTATWPVLIWLQSHLWRQRWLAVTVMTLLLLLVFVGPLTMAILTVVEQQERVIGAVKALTSLDLRTAPDWLVGLPWVGAEIEQLWNRLAATSAASLLAQVSPYVDDAVRWLLAQLGQVGKLVIHVLLTVLLAALMYAYGESAAATIRRFGWRLAGARGEQSVVLAGQAIRGVAMGVVITALVQSALGGIGLAIAGVPAAGALTAAMLILCIAQLGPLLVLLPSTGWLFYVGDTGWGAFLLVWSLIVGTSDNFLRPILIKRGADLPLLLILAGVIGGLFAFGLIGIFVGPVMLAVTYTLLESWIDEGSAPPP